MWAIIDGKVEVAPAGDPRSHRQWFQAQGWTAPLDRIVRGYVLNNVLVAYKRTDGNDFSHYGVVDLILPHMHQLYEKLGLNPQTQVFFGARPAQTGEVWKGRVRLGTWFDALAQLE
jgi:hypothetical protein